MRSPPLAGAVCLAPVAARIVERAVDACGARKDVFDTMVLMTLAKAPAKVLPAWICTAALALAGCAAAPDGGAPPRSHDRAEVRDVESAPPPEDDLVYQVLVAELAGTGGDVEQSLAAWRRAMSLTDDPRVAERATRLALYAEKEDVALEAAERWAQLAETPGTQLHQILGFLYLRDGRAEPARRHLREVLTAGERPPQELFQRLESALGSTRDRRAALEVISDLVEEHPEQSAGYRLLTRLALEAGEPARALEAAEAGLALEPRDRDLTRLRVQALLALGETDEALATMESLARAHPDDWQLRLDYARRLLDAGRGEQALEEFEELHEARPDNADALYATALLTLEAGYPEQAREYFLALVELGDRLGAAHYFLGRIAEDSDRITEALHWYGMVEEGEYRSQAALRRAVILGRQGRMARSREAFDNYRARFPEHAIRAYLLEADMLRDTGQRQEAIRVYDEALAAHPGQTDLLYGRALLYATRGEVAEAEDDLRRILEENPQHAHALNALGYTLVDSTDRIREGLELIRRAHEQEPDDPAILDSLGWAYYRLGEYGQAVEYLERAHEEQPDGEIAAHFGEVLWQMGERDRARSVWRDALERAPEHRVLIETLERLAPEVLPE